MTIIEKTRELGEMIQNSEEMKVLKAAEARQAEDENAKTLMLEYSMRRMNLERDLMEGKISQEEAVQKNQEAFMNVVEQSETLKATYDAQVAVDKMVNEINAILTYYITGQTPGCTHDCSTCGGCH